MGVTQINLGDSTERKCTKYGLAHQIPSHLSVRRKPSLCAADMVILHWSAILVARHCSLQIC